MANYTALQRLIGVGDELRQTFLSESLDTRRTIICVTENLLADLRIHPETPPSINELLRHVEKPPNSLCSKIGPAPENARWICILCGEHKNIFTKTSDLRVHLNEKHGYQKLELIQIFDPKDRNRFWEYFGPYTYKDAKANGWSVSSFHTRKRKAKTGMLSEVVQTYNKINKKAKEFKKRLSTGSDPTNDPLSGFVPPPADMQMSHQKIDLEGSTAVPPDGTISTFCSLSDLTYFTCQSPQTMSFIPREEAMGEQAQNDLLRGIGDSQSDLSINHQRTQENVMDSLILDGTNSKDHIRTTSINGFISDHRFSSPREHSDGAINTPFADSPYYLELSNFGGSDGCHSQSELVDLSDFAPNFD